MSYLVLQVRGYLLAFEAGGSAQPAHSRATYRLNTVAGAAATNVSLASRLSILGLSEPAGGDYRNPIS